MAEEYILAHYKDKDWNAYRIFTNKEWEEFQVLIPSKFDYYDTTYTVNAKDIKVITDKKRVEGFRAFSGDLLNCGKVPIFEILSRLALYFHFNSKLKILPFYAKQVLSMKRRYESIVRNVKLDTNNEEIKEILSNIEEEVDITKDLRVSLLEVFKRDKEKIFSDLEKDTSDVEYTEFEVNFDEDRKYILREYSNDKYMQFALLFRWIPNLEYPIGRVDDISDFYQYHRTFDSYATEIEKEFIEPALKKYLAKDLKNIVIKFLI